MATTADFRNGFTFQDGDNLFSIVEFLHVKPGKGGAFVRTKLRNVKTKASIFLGKIKKYLFQGLFKN